MKKVSTLLYEMGLRGGAALHAAQASGRQYYERHAVTPGLKMMYAGVSAASFLAVMLIPRSGHAQTLGDSITTANSTVSTVKESVGYLGETVAAVCGLAGGKKMHQRSSEGEQSQVKMGHIAGLFGAAILSGAGGAWIQRTGATFGLTSSDYGTEVGS